LCTAERAFSPFCNTTVTRKSYKAAAMRSPKTKLLAGLRALVLVSLTLVTAQVQAWWAPEW
jgi:hypothetical protein